jgi:hypothetical protein
MLNMNMTIVVGEQVLVKDLPIKLDKRPIQSLEFAEVSHGLRVSRGFWKPLTLEADCDQLTELAFSHDSFNLIMSNEFEKWELGNASVIDFDAVAANNLMDFDGRRNFTVNFKDVYFTTKELNYAESS